MPLSKSRAEIALTPMLFGALAVILVAGLWPFNPFPANQVAWLEEGNGLEFEPNAVSLSEAPLNLPSPDWTSISLELWLLPKSKLRDSRTFFSIYTPQNPRQFRLMQYDDVLLVRRERKGAENIAINESVFANAPVFVTISSGPKGVRIYSDGKPGREFPGRVLNGRDLSGQLIIGSSPFEAETWKGEWKALAVYGSELSPAQVLDHYQKWMSGRQAEIINEFATVVLFDFHERAGGAIRDLTGKAPDLLIPRYYFVPHKPMLQAPWKEYHLSGAAAVGVVEDVALNIAGFVPFGFLLAVFLWCVARCKRPVLTAILLGALTSLIIELLQAYIPQRSSGVTDVLTNTFGTALGAIPSGIPQVRVVLGKLGLTRESKATGRDSPLTRPERPSLFL